MLTIQQLEFLDYGPFTFSIDAGESISIQGSSGSGKSLLLRAIADLDQHTGHISMNGEKQAAMPAHQWRRNIGFLFSDYLFWADTIAEHFHDTDEPFVQQTAITLQIEHLFQQPVANLSSGEKQRVALLRLLANKPVALLLDEPTSHLDEELTLAAERVITDYQQAHQCPMILVSHDGEQCQRLTSKNYRMQNNSLQEITE